MRKDSELFVVGTSSQVGRTRIPPNLYFRGNWNSYTGDALPSSPFGWKNHSFLPIYCLIRISWPNPTTGIKLTSNCWFLELKEFIPDKSDDKTRFSDSCVSEKNKFKVVYSAGRHIKLLYCGWKKRLVYIGTDSIYVVVQRSNWGKWGMSLERGVVLTAW